MNQRKWTTVPVVVLIALFFVGPILFAQLWHFSQFTEFVEARGLSIWSLRGNWEFMTSWIGIRTVLIALAISMIPYFCLAVILLSKRNR